MLEQPSKQIIEQNFSRGAKNYDRLAEIQKIAAKELCEIAITHTKSPNKILDLGSGTSFIAKFLNKSYNGNIEIFELDLAKDMLETWVDRPSNIKTILSDFENLIENSSLSPNSFDLITSSFSLQWSNNLEQVFSQVFNLLKPGGVFAFCLPTIESLKELKTASENSKCNFYFKDLPDSQTIIDFLENAKFTKVKTVEKILKQNFKNGYKALRSIKDIGANKDKVSHNLINKTKLQQFNKFCLKNSKLGNKKSISSGFEISWNITYFIYFK